jgi:integrase
MGVLGMARRSVDPIRELAEVKRVRKMLLQQGKLRDALIFCIGCNNGLRAGDLLNIKVGQVRDAKINQKIRITEQKTGKENFFILNKTCHSIMQDYLKSKKLKNSDYLFRSQRPNKKGEYILSYKSLNDLIKLWSQMAGIEGNFGCHTLRKTFGYIQYTHFKTDVNILAERFKHSSPAITRRYIGIDEDAVQNCLLNEI